MHAQGVSSLRPPREVYHVQCTPSPGVASPQGLPLVVSGVEGSPCVIGRVNPVAGNPVVGAHPRQPDPERPRRTIDLDSVLFPNGAPHHDVALPHDGWRLDLANSKNVAALQHDSWRLEPFYVQRVEPVYVLVSMEPQHIPQSDDLVPRRLFD